MHQDIIHQTYIHMIWSTHKIYVLWVTNLNELSTWLAAYIGKLHHHSLRQPARHINLLRSWSLTALSLSPFLYMPEHLTVLRLARTVPTVQLAVVRNILPSFAGFQSIGITLQWRYNEHDGVSNHQAHDCLLKRLFRRRSKKTSKLRVTGICEGNSTVTGEFPAQRASNATNSPIWWRHYGRWDSWTGNGSRGMLTFPSALWRVCLPRHLLTTHNNKMITSITSNTGMEIPRASPSPCGDVLPWFVTFGWSAVSFIGCR